MDFTSFGSISSFFRTFSESDFFFFVKLISGFAIAVLLIADILLLSKRVRTDMRIAVYGSGSPRLKKSKYMSRWESISKKLDDKSVASGKVAIVEADKMLDEILGKLGFSGKDTEEKITQVKSGQLVGIQEMREIHSFHKKIVDDPTYETSLNEIKTALAAYERVFRGLSLID